MTTRSPRKATPAKSKPAARRPTVPVKKPVRPAKVVAKRPTPPIPAKGAKSPAKPSSRPGTKVPPKGGASTPAAATVAPPRSPTDRSHILSLSFLRDGDEFMARLETDAGQITELKNRSLDQLLTLVAGELEDLLE